MWGMKQMPAAHRPKNKKHVINQPHTIIDKKHLEIASLRSPRRERPSGRGLGAWRNDNSLSCSLP
jgi:hypothetical protein